MKIICSLFKILLFSASPIISQPISNFTGHTLNQKQLTFPLDTKGKFTILCFATSLKSQNYLQTWLDPIYQKYIAKTGIMDDAFDVNVYFIPVLKTSSRHIQENIQRQFSDNTPNELRSHVVFSDSPAEPLIAELKLSDESLPYIYLLDKNGNIIYKTSGAYTEDKFDAIDDLIE